MSDTYSIDAPYTPDIESIARQAQSAYEAFPSPEKAQELQSRLSTMKGQEIEETAPVRERNLSRIRQDLSTVNSKYENISPVQDKVQPWNPNDHPISNPLEAFGSYAGVFAMLASAFTRQPLENTLNAGAAAINSVRKGDLEAYERAHTAWKENNDLVFKTHEAERQDYNDAITKMKTGIVGGEAEMAAVAAKYNDQVVKAYLDAGMNKEAMDIIAKRADLADKLLSIQPKLVELGQQQYQSLLFQKAAKEENDKRQQAGQPLMSAQELVQLRGQIKEQYSGAGSSTDAIRLRNLQDKAISDENAKRESEGMPPLTAEEEARTKGNIARLSMQNIGTFSGAKDKALAIRDEADRLYKEAKDKGSPITYAEAQAQATRNFEELAKPMTPNERNKIKVHVDQIDESGRAIERIEKTIEKYTGAVGAAGYARRIGERITNIMGSNRTDLEQVRRDIEYLRLNAPRLLTESPAKPLAADVARINAIVAGLQFGDTGANTLRALEEIKGIYARSRASALSRLNNTWQPGGEAEPQGTPSAPGAPARSGNPWDNDPVLK